MEQAKAKQEQRRVTMEQLERDLRFFRQELATERDQFRRNLLLGQIREVEQQIVNLLRVEREQAERENKNLRDFLDKVMKMKKK